MTKRQRELLDLITKHAPLRFEDAAWRMKTTISGVSRTAESLNWEHKLIDIRYTGNGPLGGRSGGDPRNNIMELR